MKPTLSRRSRVSCFSFSVVMSTSPIHADAAGEAVEPGGALHQRRLARAGRTHDRGEPAALEADGDAVQRTDLGLTLAVDLVAARAPVRPTPAALRAVVTAGSSGRRTWGVAFVDGRAGRAVGSVRWTVRGRRRRSAESGGRVLPGDLDRARSPQRPGTWSATARCSSGPPRPGPTRGPRPRPSPRPLRRAAASSVGLSAKKSSTRSIRPRSRPMIRAEDSSMSASPSTGSGSVSRMVVAVVGDLDRVLVELAEVDRGAHRAGDQCRHPLSGQEVGQVLRVLLQVDVLGEGRPRRR